MKRNHRKSTWMKGVSAVLAAALVFGQTGILSFAKTETDTVKTSKEETVYVISGADGAVQKLIVSDWLKNTGKETTLSDLSELTNIENVKGEESFTQNEKNNVDWEAKGKDIYYQGTLKKDVPVEQKISYQLDGKDISPEKLAGKSGKVQVCFDYANHQKEKVMVNGKEEELYVPFVVLTAMILDNENFSNVEVSSGKIIGDGERTVVVGYAMPGLEDNLKPESMGLEKLDLPQKIEVSFDAVDFELAGTMTIVTSEIFNNLDINVDDKQQTLSKDMKDLQDAMQALMDGTSELYDGVLQLADGTEELNDGISSLDQGAGDLKDGAGKLYEGVGSLNDGVSTLKDGAGALLSGMQQLNAGLETLDNNTAALKGGISSIQQGILGSLNTKIQEANTLLNVYGISGTPAILREVSLASYGQDIAANVNALQAVISTLDGNMNNVKSALGTIIASQNTQQSENQEQVNSESEESNENQAVTEEVLPQPENNVEEEGSFVPQGNVSQEPSTPSGDKEQPEGASGQQETSEQAQGASEQPKTEETTEPIVQEREVVIVQASAGTENPLNALIEQLLTLQTAKTKLEALMETMTSMKTLLDGTTQLSGGIDTYTAGVASAHQGVGTLLSNAPKLTGGVDTLKEGTGQLLKGAGDLYDGTKKLKDGTVSLKDGGNELKKGVSELQTGALKLKDGTVEFNDQGIKKLVELLDEDLPELTGRLEGTLDAAMAYKSFSGISEQMDGSVKFIYKTDAIKSE